MKKSISMLFAMLVFALSSFTANAETKAVSTNLETIETTLTQESIEHKDPPVIIIIIIIVDNDDDTVS